jgi:autocrine motility factor receptor
LQSWLEQDTSCPTCRMVLSIQSPAGLEAASHLEHNLLAGENQVDNQTTNRRPPNHFFHFDGKYREIISLGDENTANARWEPAGTVPVTRQRR